MTPLTDCSDVQPTLNHRGVVNGQGAAEDAHRPQQAPRPCRFQTFDNDSFLYKMTESIKHWSSHRFMRRSSGAEAIRRFLCTVSTIQSGRISPPGLLRRLSLCHSMLETFVFKIAWRAGSLLRQDRIKAEYFAEVKDIISISESTADMSPNYAIQLNNYLQRIGTPAALTWHDSREGLEHSVQWTSRAKINGEIKGVGTGSNKKEAQAIAAKEALMALGEPV